MILYLIDDDRAAHVYHSMMIEEADLSDLVVENYLSVEEAISALGSSTQWPDVILLDINMPVHTGWDFLEFYAQQFSDRIKPAIYMVTNSENPGDMEKAKSNPLVDGYELKFLDSEYFTQLATNLKN